MFLKHAAVLRKTEGDQYTIFSPKHVIDRLNTTMIQQQLKGSLFATVCCCQLNTETLEFSFARAGHPYPILIRPGQDPILLQSRGGLLGVFEEMDFEQVHAPLCSGDKILLYSDGVEPLIGQIEDNGQFIFTETFQKLSRLPIISMTAAIEEAVAGWKRTSAETDDITVLGMEIV
jgi:sigma-B regulation protein RsbU (phosphoserine phosphatase)